MVDFTLPGSAVETIVDSAVAANLAGVGSMRLSDIVPAAVRGTANAASRHPYVAIGVAATVGGVAAWKTTELSAPYVRKGWNLTTDAVARAGRSFWTTVQPAAEAAADKAQDAADTIAAKAKAEEDAKANDLAAKAAEAVKADREAAEAMRAEAEKAKAELAELRKQRAEAEKAREAAQAELDRAKAELEKAAEVAAANGKSTPKPRKAA